MEKTKQIYVHQNWQILYLQQQVLAYGCPRGQMIYFSFVIHFIRSDWRPKQMTIGMFEATKTSS